MKFKYVLLVLCIAQGIVQGADENKKLKGIFQAHFSLSDFKKPFEGKHSLIPLEEIAYPGEENMVRKYDLEKVYESGSVNAVGFLKDNECQRRWIGSRLIYLEVVKSESHIDDATDKYKDALKSTGWVGMLIHVKGADTREAWKNRATFINTFTQACEQVKKSMKDGSLVTEKLQREKGTLSVSYAPFGALNQDHKISIGMGSKKSAFSPYRPSSSFSSLSKSS